MTGVPNTVLGKVMLVLHAFGADDDELGFAELGRRTGLPKATLHRLLAELVEVRLLDRGARGHRLGGHLFELGMRASVERRLVEVFMPYLEDLYERTHETVHLGLLEGREVVYAAKIGGHRQAPSPSAWAAGCRCTPPRSARPCWPTPRHGCAPRCSAPR
ncbi:IclR helix-turn-helix domain-containing protein [Lentzea fradiae]|uniref:IclR helix-turn-helix domain-containing protein n=1 Tax=Lentzea fradiae TaxID=200378 RepID=A0A1G7ZSQ7_9PSEU|nr:helix-turn-helix domain-containing protein [Lentzea fradiae]SDH11708.1 IclR helix-turn-helix domain-containing protein [Lentzea fradiae]